MITQPLTKGVKNLAFSNDGKYLVAFAMDYDQMMAVFERAKPPMKPGQPLTPVAHGNSTRTKVLRVGFDPSGQTVVATCVKEVSFFTYANGVVQAQKGTGWGAKGPARLSLERSCLQAPNRETSCRGTVAT